MVVVNGMMRCWETLFRSVCVIMYRWREGSHDGKRRGRGRVDFQTDRALYLGFDGNF